MLRVLEFFSLHDFIPLVLLFGLVEFVGAQMAERNATVMWWARGAGAAGFLLYAVAGVAEWGPTTAGDFLVLGVRALLAMGLCHGLARVLVPVALFFHFHFWAQPRGRRIEREKERALRADAEKFARDAAGQKQAEQERLEEQRRRRDEERANRPTPPTREERMAAARKRHDDTVRMLEEAGLNEIELMAGKEKAKQDYLREIDGAL